MYVLLMVSIGILWLWRSIGNLVNLFVRGITSPSILLTSWQLHPVNISWRHDPLAIHPFSHYTSGKVTPFTVGSGANDNSDNAHVRSLHTYYCMCWWATNIPFAEGVRWAISSDSGQVSRLFDENMEGALGSTSTILLASREVFRADKPQGKVQVSLVSEQGQRQRVLYWGKQAMVILKVIG